jgi:hypothetical protein
MTVMVIVGLISIFVGQLLIFNDHAYQTVDQTSESQQNLRAAIDLIERDLRHAGMMVPEDAGICGVDNDNAPDQLYVSDWSAIDSANDFSDYGGSTILLPPTLNTGVTLTLDLSSLVMEPSPPLRAAYDTNGDGTNDSDFLPGGGIIIADPGTPNRGTACGTVQTVDLANDRLTVVLVSTLENPGTGGVIAVPAIEYRVTGAQLFWNGFLLAGGIEDFQVAYFFDLNEDNIVDPNDVQGDGVGNDYDSDDEPAQLLREVRASLVARTRREDPEFDRGQLQVRENRDPTGVSDGFRRRTVTTRVRLRNIGTRLGVV